ncbi:MAG: hypothetical protein B7Z37_02305 [Verrucomicrobia bacterium 12-59-8]|nr:MAG: hypothetical protein B7Z37_02305 [Verrucomicrobia bacterium 12-59-8]
MRSRHSFLHWFKPEQWLFFARLLAVGGRAFLRNNGPSWAAAIAYYSLLSIFPLLLAAGSVASYFIDPQWAVLKVTALLGDFLPKGRVAIEAVVKETLEGGGVGLLFFLPMIWTGTLVFGALTKALNIAFQGTNHRSYLRQMKVRLIMLLSLGVIFGLALGSSTLLRVIQATVGILPVGGEFLLALLRGVAPTLLLLLGFLLTYRFVPAKRPGWRAAWVGASVASLAFVIAKPVFLGYVQVLARYNFVYGSLGGIIAAVIWAWVVSMIGIFGGQITWLWQCVVVDGESLEVVERRCLSRQHKP